MRAGAATVAMLALLALTSVASVRGATPGVCDAVLSEWQVKQAFGGGGFHRLTVAESREGSSYSCTWAYAAKGGGRSLVLHSVDLRFARGGKARVATIADELCRMKVACGSRLKPLRAAPNASRAFKEIGKAFLTTGKARNVTLASGAPALVAVAAGRLTGSAYTLREGWLDTIACVETPSYEIDVDCSVKALQYLDDR